VHHLCLAIKPRFCFQNLSLSRLRCLGVASAYRWVKILLYCLVKIIKKYLGKCFSSPRCLRGEKVPNVDPSHLICER
jgi:hypothetical protein